MKERVSDSEGERAGEVVGRVGGGGGEGQTSPSLTKCFPPYGWQVRTAALERRPSTANIGSSRMPLGARFSQAVLIQQDEILEFSGSHRTSKKSAH